MTDRETSPSNTSTAAAHESAERRVGVVTGQRSCHKCHYSLTGQSIIREPKYELLIARCPECGAVSPLQEYPALDRWSRRLAAIAAGFVLLLVVVLWMAGAGTMCGFSIGSAETSTWRFARAIDNLYEQDNPDPGATGVPQMLAGPNGQFVITPPDLGFEQWWQQQDKAQLVAQAGGVSSVLDLNGLVGFSFIAILIMFLFGIFWSIILIRRGFVTTLVCAVVITLTGLLFSSFALTDWLNEPAMTSWRAARSYLGPPVLLSMLAVQMIVLLIGMQVGRPIVRGVVRLLVPPALWPSLSWLWTARGLNPPRPKL